MTRLKAFIIPVAVLPLMLFVALQYPVIRVQVELRVALLPVYYLSRQLSAEVKAAEASADDLPPRYGSILADYEGLLKNRQVLEVARLSAEKSEMTLAQRWLARYMLHRRGLPSDLLVADPVCSLQTALEETRGKERESAAMRDDLVAKQTLGSIRHQPPRTTLSVTRRGLPPDVTKNGFSVCGEKIPLDQAAVSNRITYQIEHLLTDLRDSTGIWLKRRQRYGNIVTAILDEESVPRDFALVAALESGYDAMSVSPAGARGWWQFTKATAVQSMALTPGEDWTLEVSKFRDDRCDLVLSTRSAARYLKWMREHLGRSGKKASWLLVASAYNAGFAKTRDRVAAYGGLSFWDTKLPPETEVYVPRWIALCIIDSHQAFYDLKVPDVPPLEIETLDGLKPQADIPLALIAAVTESSEQMTRKLNPALDRSEKFFRAGNSGQDMTHTIHVPKGYREAVLRVLEENGYLRTRSGIARVSGGPDKVRNPRSRP
jgi:membrane-bound lytic murein transglycosylase D